MGDSTTPLCTWQQFNTGAFADLAKRYTDPQAQADLLLEATRLCEQEARRRFAPFTNVTEMHPARGIDPNRYGSSAFLPLDQTRSQGRHCWVNEYAPRYPEMWTYSNVSVQLAYGGAGTSIGTQIQGPEPETGHLWFDLDLTVPVRSTLYVKVTYSGGYTTIPADLVRACKFMVAALVARELAPTQRDPETLHADAVVSLLGYTRD